LGRQPKGKFHAATDAASVVQQDWGIHLVGPRKDVESRDIPRLVMTNGRVPAS